MDDFGVSSSSSRGASASSGDTLRHAAIGPCSMTELSRQFDQHTLEPQKRASFARSPPSQSYHLHPTMGRDLSFSTNSHHASRRPRESMIRRQCSAASMSRLSSLVQDLLREEGSTYDASHTSPSSNSDSVPPLSSHERPQLGSPTSSFASTSSCSEDSEFEPQRSLGTGTAYKVGKDLMHSTSREGVSRQFKDIRVRKASRRR